MDAKLQKIQITPAKLDSEGNIKTPEAAVIALEVPIDSISQKEAIVGLLDVLRNEWVIVTITAKQLQLAEGVATRKVSNGDGADRRSVTASPVGLQSDDTAMKHRNRTALEMEQ